MRPIDFSRSARTAPLLGWALLLAGAVACALAFGWRARESETARRAEARLEERRAQIAQENRPKPAVAPTPQERRLAQARRDLSAPWLATLRAIEGSAVEPVFLRSLAIEPAAGAIRIEAEAPRLEEALDFVRALDRDPLLSPVSLTSHQPAADPLGGSAVVLFGASARWPAP